MTIDKKLRQIITGAALASAAVLPAKGAIIITDAGVGEVSGTVTAEVNYTNDDTGVSYNSLQSDSQWFDMWKQAYDVSNTYVTDADLASSGFIGYNISNGSAIKTGWNATQNANGTISFTNVGGIEGNDYDSFAKPATLSGNFFAAPQLNDMDGDTLPNYNLKFLDDLTTSELNDARTIVGAIGANNGGNSIYADAGINSNGASGKEYALVPTANHPIPEPSTYAAILGAVAGASLLLRRRNRAFAVIQTP